MNSILICKDKKKLIKMKKNNARLYPIYKMFSWDLLFYYAIIFVFLTQTKGLSLSTVMFVDALYPIFKCLFRLPSDFIIDNLGKRKSLMLANFFIFLGILILIISNGIASVLLSWLLQAFGFAIKGVVETNLLYDSLTSRNGHSLYTKLDEKGASGYYYLDGVASLLTGFLFVINGYIPILICLMFTVISIAMSSCFKDIYVTKKSNSFKTRFDNYKKELTSSSHFIFTSSRLKALMIFIIFFAGFLYISGNYREGLLTDLGVSPQYFAIIISVLTFLSGIGTTYTSKIQHFFKNKTLSFISLTYAFSFVAIGIVVLTNLNFTFQLSSILFLYLLLYLLQGPYYTLRDRYLKSFATPNMRIKIASTFNIIQSLAEASMAFIASIVLEVLDVSTAFLVTGAVGAVILFGILSYMKPRFGLKPEQYSKKDIEVLEKNQKNEGE